MTKYAGRSLTVDFEGSPLGQLRTFSEFGSTRALIDASVYGEEWTSFVPGLQDGTVVTGQIVIDPADAGKAAIEAAYSGAPDTVVTFTATHTASGESFDICCILTKVAYESALDGLFAMNFEAKIVDPGVALAS